MLQIVCEEVALIGLALHPDKLQWTSFPAMPSESLHWDGHTLAWQQFILFTGGIVNLSGDAEPALAHRRAASTRTWRPWKTALFS
eukprot:12630203-Prorocentrum_lima.AAC.1